jgi:hypothetical protein
MTTLTRDGVMEAPGRHVASNHPATRLDRPISTLLHGDVPCVVAELKESSRTNLVIMGSGVVQASLRLVESVTTGTGVVIATYEREERA